MLYLYYPPLSVSDYTAEIAENARYLTERYISTSVHRRAYDSLQLRRHLPQVQQTAAEESFHFHRLHAR